MTTIQNARSFRDEGVYIGRSHPRFPRGSPLGNPFKEGRDGSRSEVVTRYRSLLRYAWMHGGPAKDELLRLADLYQSGSLAALVCWCAPLPCHGDVVLQALREIAGEIPPDITDPTTRLLITGSREATPMMIGYVREIVGVALGKGWKVIVGDADGVDAAAIQSCDVRNCRVEVHGAYNKMRRRSLTGENNTHMGTFLERDRIMAERADLVYAVWNGASRGTKYTFEYAHWLLKDVRVANFSQFPPQIDDLQITIPCEFRP